MKIRIPTKEEKEKASNTNEENAQETTENVAEDYITTSSGISINGETTDNGNISNNQNVKININTATQTQLESLPGIGPSIATKIISYRKENGKFKTIEDIKGVSGIGDSKFANIKDYITVK